jgi:predicted DsbA family dithiol-disulfide isomerase
LILWAENFDKGDDLLEAIYSAYFEKKEQIFSHDDLVTIAISVGINPAEALSFLQSDQLRDRVSEDQNLAHQLGANGVPFYVIDMKFAISGAQPQEVFDQIFTQG